MRWRTIARRRNALQSEIALWIAHHFERMGKLRAKAEEDFIAGVITDAERDQAVNVTYANAFTLPELMSALGLDYDNRSDYSRVYSAITRERKRIKENFQEFINSAEYTDAKARGDTDTQIWQAFNDAAYSYNMFILYCDADGRYKQIDFYSYGMFISSRMQHIHAELMSKAEEVGVISAGVPSITNSIARLDIGETIRKQLVHEPEEQT